MRRILVVDDEAGVREFVAEALEADGFEALAVQSAERALAELAKSSFGLMFTDLKMPGMGGLELLTRAREMQPELEVIVLTAQGSVDSAVEAMKLGAFDFIQKPVSGLESELFGHEKGAFTGAQTTKRGRIELAAGGTFFLDEVGELKPDLQAKLLRVLQERSFERLGGSRSIGADVRWLAATNRDLTKMVAAGEFREDLYHRLAVFPIRVPALRERRADIAPLTRRTTTTITTAARLTI